MRDFVEILRTELVNWYTNLVKLLPRLAFAVLFFIVAYLLADMVRRALRRRLDRRSDDRLLSSFLSRMAKGILLLLAVGLVLRIIGLSGIATGLVAGAGVGAFVIGFAFKDIGENFLAGMLLAFDRPFKTGDLVQLDSFKGKVCGISLRATHMKTADGRDVYIPNSTVVKSPVINFTEDGFLRHELDFRLSHLADLDAASAIIRRELATIPGVLGGERAPAVRIGEVGPDSVDLKLTYWVDVFDDERSEGHIRYDVVQRTIKALRQAGFAPPPTSIDVRQVPPVPTA